jgi:hypothetical protein
MKKKQENINRMFMFNSLIFLFSRRIHVNAVFFYFSKAKGGKDKKDDKKQAAAALAQQQQNAADASLTQSSTNFAMMDEQTRLKDLVFIYLRNMSSYNMLLTFTTKNRLLLAPKYTSHSSTRISKFTSNK